MRRPSPQTSRWGLLITSIALGLVLLANGIIGYVGARRAYQSVVEARSLDMFLATRRHIASGDGSVDDDSLAGVIEEMEEQGLRYIGVFESSGRLVAQAGQPESQPAPGRIQRRMGPEIEHLDERVRATAKLRAGPRQRMERRGERPRPGKRQAFRKALEKRLKKGRRPGRSRVMVIELEPVVASAITSRALIMLIVSLAASLLLVGAAVVFWRLSSKAEKMEKELARDKHLKDLGKMSAVLGHELKNPLASLKGHAQLLVERLDGEHPGRRGAETVVREALRLETLTKQILDFAKTGALSLSHADPLVVARSAMDSCEGDVELVANQKIPPWPMDEEKMERVLQNVIRNAVQASEQGQKVDVTITTEGTERLLFAIRDRGKGLDPKDKEWIFEPFRTGKVKGTGLGLAIASRIVNAHGGGIIADNHPEGGALFTIWLSRRGSK